MYEVDVSTTGTRTSGHNEMLLTMTPIDRFHCTSCVSYCQYSHWLYAGANVL